jgi:NitT/TauT family transport system substrate-binding protein
MKNKLILIVLPLLALFLTACGGVETTLEPVDTDAEQTEEPLVHIRLPMGYIPNIQYAPYYVAVEKGYYAEEGIEIEFDYSLETDGVTLVGANDLQFAVVSGEQVLLARAQELPVVYVMAWYHDYPVAVIAKSEQEFRTPQDLAGAVIGIPGTFGASYVGLRALFNEAGLKESDVMLNSIGFNQVESLVTDQSQAVVGYVTNEPIQLKSLGYDVDVIRVADYVHLASNGLLTNEATLAGNPGLIEGMVRATLRGIADTIEDPDGAYRTSLNYVEGLSLSDEVVQKEILNTSIAFWESDRLGYSDPLAWEKMQEVLLDMGLITEPLDLSKAFSNQFVGQ